MKSIRKERGQHYCRKVSTTQKARRGGGELNWRGLYMLRKLKAPGRENPQEEKNGRSEVWKPLSGGGGGAGGKKGSGSERPSLSTVNSFKIKKNDLET